MRARVPSLRHDMRSALWHIFLSGINLSLTETDETHQFVKVRSLEVSGTLDTCACVTYRKRHHHPTASTKAKAIAGRTDARLTSHNRVITIP